MSGLQGIRRSEILWDGVADFACSAVRHGIPPLPSGMGPAPAISYAQDPVIICVAVGHHVPGKAAEKARRTLSAAVRLVLKEAAPLSGYLLRWHTTTSFWTYIRRK